MPAQCYYAQQCPACHKMLSIDVKTLGFNIVCRHCESEFTAKDHTQSSAAIEDPINFWINFTDHGNKTSPSEPLNTSEPFLDDSQLRRPR